MALAVRLSDRHGANRLDWATFKERYLENGDRAKGIEHEDRDQSSRRIRGSSGAPHVA